MSASHSDRTGRNVHGCDKHYLGSALRSNLIRLAETLGMVYKQ